MRLNFDIRRQIFLNISDPISENSWAQRLANTYAFIFNATCDKKDVPPMVNFNLEWRKESEPRLETSILATMLRMHYEMAAIKKLSGANYLWVEELDAFYETFENILKDKIPRNLAKMEKQKVAFFEGFFQYEKTLMSLNESLQLCL